MYSKQFPTNEDAEDYMHKAGQVKFIGRSGERMDTYIYTLTIGNTVYQIMLTKGYLKVFHERYV